MRKDLEKKKKQVDAQDTDEKHSQIAIELNDMGIGKILVEKISFLYNAGLLFSVREKFLMTLEANYFQQKIQIEFQPPSQHLNLQCLIYLNQK